MGLSHEGSEGICFIMAKIHSIYEGQRVLLVSLPVFNKIILSNCGVQGAYFPDYFSAFQKLENFIGVVISAQWWFVRAIKDCLDKFHISKRSQGLINGAQLEGCYFCCTELFRDALCDVLRNVVCE